VKEVLLKVSYLLQTLMYKFFIQITCAQSYMLQLVTLHIGIADVYLSIFYFVDLLRHSLDRCQLISVESSVPSSSMWNFYIKWN